MILLKNGIVKWWDQTPLKCRRFLPENVLFWDWDLHKKQRCMQDSNDPNKV